MKKTALSAYDSNRTGGLIAVNLRDDDELIGAALCSADDDLLLVSKKGMSIRFKADDEQLRPMGRDTGGVRGMAFREGDELLSMDVVRAADEERYVFTVTDGGYAKRSKVEEYKVQGRSGLGIKAMKLSDARGAIVGALIVGDEDEVLCIRQSGSVTRSPVADVEPKGRDTMGVIFVKLDEGDAVVALARNEPEDDEPLEGDEAPAAEGSEQTEPAAEAPAQVEEPGEEQT